MQLHTHQFLSFLLTAGSATSRDDDESWPPLLFECDADGGGASTQGLDEGNPVSVDPLSHHQKACVSSTDASRRLAANTVLRRGFLHQFFPLFESKKRRFAVLKSNCLFLFLPSELPEDVWLTEHQERLKKCRCLREVIGSFTKDNKHKQKLASLFTPAREEFRVKSDDHRKKFLTKANKDKDGVLGRGEEEEDRIGDGVEVLFLENVVIRPVKRRVFDGRFTDTAYGEARPGGAHDDWLGGVETDEDVEDGDREDVRVGSWCAGARKGGREESKKGMAEERNKRSSGDELAEYGISLHFPACFEENENKFLFFAPTRQSRDAWLRALKRSSNLSGQIASLVQEAAESRFAASRYWTRCRALRYEAQRWRSQVACNAEDEQLRKCNAAEHDKLCERVVMLEDLLDVLESQLVQVEEQKAQGSQTARDLAALQKVLLAEAEKTARLVQILLDVSSVLPSDLANEIRRLTQKLLDTSSFLPAPCTSSPSPPPSRSLSPPCPSSSSSSHASSPSPSPKVRPPSGHPSSSDPAASQKTANGKPPSPPFKKSKDSLPTDPPVSLMTPESASSAAPVITAMKAKLGPKSKGGGIPPSKKLPPGKQRLPTGPKEAGAPQFVKVAILGRVPPSYVLEASRNFSEEQGICSKYCSASSLSPSSSLTFSSPSLQDDIRDERVFLSHFSFEADCRSSPFCVTPEGHVVSSSSPRLILDDLPRSPPSEHDTVGLPPRSESSWQCGLTDRVSVLEQAEEDEVYNTMTCSGGPERMPEGTECRVPSCSASRVGCQQSLRGDCAWTQDDGYLDKDSNLRLGASHSYGLGAGQLHSPSVRRSSSTSSSLSSLLARRGQFPEVLTDREECPQYAVKHLWSSMIFGSGPPTELDSTKDVQKKRGEETKLFPRSGSGIRKSAIVGEGPPPPTLQPLRKAGDERQGGGGEGGEVLPASCLTGGKKAIVGKGPPPPTLQPLQKAEDERSGRRGGGGGDLGVYDGDRAGLVSPRLTGNGQVSPAASPRSPRSPSKRGQLPVPPSLAKKKMSGKRPESSITSSGPSASKPSPPPLLASPLDATAPGVRESLLRVSPSSPSLTLSSSSASSPLLSSSGAPLLSAGERGFVSSEAAHPPAAKEHGRALPVRVPPSDSMPHKKPLGGADVEHRKLDEGAGELETPKVTESVSAKERMLSKLAQQSRPAESGVLACVLSLKKKSGPSLPPEKRKKDGGQSTEEGNGKRESAGLRMKESANDSEREQSSPLPQREKLAGKKSEGTQKSAEDEQRPNRNKGVSFAAHPPSPGASKFFVAPNELAETPKSRKTSSHPSEGIAGVEGMSREEGESGREDQVAVALDREAARGVIRDSPLPPATAGPKETAVTQGATLLTTQNLKRSVDSPDREAAVGAVTKKDTGVLHVKQEYCSVHHRRESADIERKQEVAGVIRRTSSGTREKGDRGTRREERDRVTRGDDTNKGARGHMGEEANRAEESEEGSQGDTRDKGRGGERRASAAREERGDTLGKRVSLLVASNSLRSDEGASVHVKRHKHKSRGSLSRRRTEEGGNHPLRVGSSQSLESLHRRSFSRRAKAETQKDQQRSPVRDSLLVDSVDSGRRRFLVEEGKDGAERKPSRQEMRPERRRSRRSALHSVRLLSDADRHATRRRRSLRSDQSGSGQHHNLNGKTDIVRRLQWLVEDAKSSALGASLIRKLEALHRETELLSHTISLAEVSEEEGKEGSSSVKIVHQPDASPPTHGGLKGARSHSTVSSSSFIHRSPQLIESVRAAFEAPSEKPPGWSLVSAECPQPADDAEERQRRERMMKEAEEEKRRAEERKLEEKRKAEEAAAKAAAAKEAAARAAAAAEEAAAAKAAAEPELKRRALKEESSKVVPPQPKDDAAEAERAKAALLALAERKRLQEAQQAAEEERRRKEAQAAALKKSAVESPARTFSSTVGFDPEGNQRWARLTRGWSREDLGVVKALCEPEVAHAIFRAQGARDVDLGRSQFVPVSFEDLSVEEESSKQSRATTGVSALKPLTVYDAVSDEETLRKEAEDGILGIRVRARKYVIGSHRPPSPRPLVGSSSQTRRLSGGDDNEMSELPPPLFGLEITGHMCEHIKMLKARRDAALARRRELRRRAQEEKERQAEGRRLRQQTKISSQIERTRRKLRNSSSVWCRLRGGALEHAEAGDFDGTSVSSSDSASSDSLLPAWVMKAVRGGGLCRRNMHLGYDEDVSWRECDDAAHNGVHPGRRLARMERLASDAPFNEGGYYPKHETKRRRRHREQHGTGRCLTRLGGLEAEDFRHFQEEIYSPSLPPQASDSRAESM